MDFQTLFNQHIEELDMTVKEISERTGLSASVISRYRHGERTPALYSPQYHSLLDCFYAKGQELHSPDFTLEALNELYQAVLSQEHLESQEILTRILDLLSHPEVNLKELAATTNYDVSYLYKIKNGQRKPQDPTEFLEKIQSFIKDKKTKFSTYTEAESIPDSTSFLNKMDSFNLDNFIEAIHFNDMKIPTLPFTLPQSKTYYGIEKMREAELDFFKTTALSRSRERIFMHSDMPMIEMADDIDFNKKWMFGIAAAIKKGLHIDMIHHLDRPFEELMLGLEAWIPIYMTGQVSPYYIPNYTDSSVFHHLNYVSGCCALTGQCIDGFHKDGRYEFYTRQEDIRFIRKKAQNILSKATPLMEIYDSTRHAEFQFLKESFQQREHRLIGENTFKNITIVSYGDFIIISKEKAPQIDFVIRHPTLVSAINHFQEIYREDS